MLRNTDGLQPSNGFVPQAVPISYGFQSANKNIFIRNSSTRNTVTDLLCASSATDASNSFQLRRISRYITHSEEDSDAPLYIGWKYGCYIKAGLARASDYVSRMKSLRRSAPADGRTDSKPTLANCV